MLQRVARLLAVVAILFAGAPVAFAADALYGPVRPGESFWAIADALRTRSGEGAAPHCLARLMTSRSARATGSVTVRRYLRWTSWPLW